MAGSSSNTVLFSGKSGGLNIGKKINKKYLLIYQSHTFSQRELVSLQIEINKKSIYCCFVGFEIFKWATHTQRAFHIPHLIRICTLFIYFLYKVTRKPNINKCEIENV